MLLSFERLVNYYKNNWMIHSPFWFRFFDYGFALNNYYAHNKSLFRFFSVAFQARQRKKQTHKNIKQVNLYLSVSLGWSV